MDAKNGWNGTTIENGLTVRVWDKSITGARGVVEGIVSDLADGRCCLTVTKASKSTAWQRGNRMTVGVWWLEPVA